MLRYTMLLNHWSKPLSISNLDNHMAKFILSVGCPQNYCDIFRTSLSGSYFKSELKSSVHARIHTLVRVK